MSSLHHFINALSNSKAPSSSWGQTGPNSLPSSQLARKCLWVQTANLGREKFRPRDHRPKAHHSPGNLCRGTWNCPKMCPKSLVDWENHNFQSSYSHCNMNLQFLCPVSTSCWSPRLSQWFSQPFHFMAAAPRAPMPPLLSGCSLKLFGVKGIPSSVYTLKSSPESPTSGIQEGFYKIFHEGNWPRFQFFRGVSPFLQVKFLISTCKITGFCSFYSCSHIFSVEALEVKPEISKLRLLKSLIFATEPRISPAFQGAQAAMP